MRFDILEYGDVFNTKVARWVKTKDERAMCIMSAIVPIGEYRDFDDDDDVTCLYSRMGYEENVTGYY